MKSLRLIVIAMLAILAPACSATRVESTAGSGPPSTASAASTEVASPSTARETLTRFDQQGAVSIEVTPLSLGAGRDDLEFEIAMNTHSVDLSMDLAASATLSTDMGIHIAATRWDGPRGGHHVSGRLDFPAENEGRSILDGASKLTLTIVNVGAPSRSFEWDLK